MQNKEVSRIVSAVAIVTVALGQIGVARGQSALQPPPNGPGEAPRAVLGPGDINVAASRVYIFVDKTGFGHQHAVGGRLREGSLRIAGRSAGRMVFDMQSLVADTVEARRYVGLKGEIDPKTQQDVTANMLGAGHPGRRAAFRPRLSTSIHCGPSRARGKSGQAAISPRWRVQPPRNQAAIAVRRSRDSRERASPSQGDLPPAADRLQNPAL